MININPHFTLSKYNLQSDLFAYIDESGTEGFDFSKCPKWFVVSSIVTTFAESNMMLEIVEEFRKEHRENTKLAKMTFKKLKHQKRKDILGLLKDFKYLTIHSAFYKPNIDPNDNLCNYPSMYFVGIKNVIERLSWLTSQFNKNKVHIMISNRNKIKKEDMSSYLFEFSVRAQRNLSYLNKLGFISLSSPSSHPKLLLSDFTASSIRFCLEKTGTANIVEPIYFEIFLKGRLYSSNHRRYHGVWRNGLKCTPDDQELLDYGGILEEGTHEL